jgi:hypothetical protein
LDTAPSTENWPWLGCQPLTRIAELGTDPDEMRWLHRAWAWLYPRLDEETRQRFSAPIPGVKSSGPPSKFASMLAVSAGGRGAKLVFFEVVGTTSAMGSSECELGLAKACHRASQLLSATGQDGQEWSLRFPGGEDDGLLSGTSGSGVAFFQTLRAILGLHADQDTAVTACWDADHSCFKPVVADLLADKIQLAREWGFRKLRVVEGQSGIPEELSGFEIEPFPADPRRALAYWLPEIPPENEDALLSVLVSVDRALVHGNPADRDPKELLRLTEPFIQEKISPLVKHVVHDLRSRSLLHAGKSEEADQERAQSRKFQPDILRDDWFGEYLQFEQSAHYGILALDLGRWRNDDPDHLRIDQKIEQLEQLDPPRIENVSALLKLRNVRARRLDFLGRLQEDRQLLHSAVDEYLKEQKFWPQIFEREKKLALQTTNLRRQQNQVMDPLLAIYELDGALPEMAMELDLWPDQTSVEDGVPSSPFDRAYALRWWVARGVVLSDDDLVSFLEAARGEDGRYPSNLTPEAILRSNVGGQGVRNQAARMLAASPLIINPTDPIEALLGLRIQYLCQREGVSAPIQYSGDWGGLSSIVSRLKENPAHAWSKFPY